MREAYAARYGELERWHWWFRARQTLLADVLSRSLPATSTARRIATLGCGPATGWDWLVPLAGPGGCVVGVDADPSRALRNADARGPLPAGCQFVFGALEHPPLRPGALDAVLLLDVLEHLQDDARGLSEAAKLLRPGGALLVTVPAGPSLWGHQDEVSHHFRRYTQRGLLELFARAGLRRPQVTHFNSLLYPGVAAVRWTRRALGLRPKIQSDFELSKPGPLNTVLETVMSAERHLIKRVPLPLGVSLLGLLHVG